MEVVDSLPEKKSTATLAASIEAELQGELHALMQEVTQKATDLCKELCSKRFAEALEEDRSARIRAAASRGAELKIEEAARASAAILVSAAAVSGGVRKEDTVEQVMSAVMPNEEQDQRSQGLSEIQDVRVHTQWVDGKGSKGKELHGVAERSVGKGKSKPSKGSLTPGLANAAQAQWEASRAKGEFVDDASYISSPGNSSQNSPQKQGSGEGKGVSAQQAQWRKATMMANMMRPANPNGESWESAGEEDGGSWQDKGQWQSKGQPKGSGEAGLREQIPKARRAFFAEDDTVMRLRAHHGPSAFQETGGAGLGKARGAFFAEDDNVMRLRAHYGPSAFQETGGAGLGMGAGRDEDAEFSDMHLTAPPMKGKPAIPKGKGKRKNDSDDEVGVFSTFTGFFG